ncbi:PqiC family protein [Methylomonas sp. LL1]|uniref:PqiC family protein n=1 Tax=Methylomonas sp. LL1 TaxID=2785785 RepID=UPI001E3B7746|nr:PqiC family protein [Methylomonas sp. LL1]
MMKTAQSILRISAVSLLLLQAGCIGSTPPAQFYLLEPVTDAEPAGSVSATAKPSVSIAPVRIPHYLERSQMVTATGKNTYQLHELHRWAEALDENISRVLAQDLSLLLPADVQLSNNQGAKQAQYRLTVRILEFHVDPQGQAGLTAQWQISQDDRLVKSEQSSYRLPASTDDYRVMVAALNECLNRLARDMATGFKALATE